jgi:hypothetical protein
MDVEPVFGSKTDFWMQVVPLMQTCLLQYIPIEVHMDQDW